MLVPGVHSVKVDASSARFNSGTGTSAVAAIVGGPFDPRFNGVFDLFPVLISWDAAKGRGRKTDDGGRITVG